MLARRARSKLVPAVPMPSVAGRARAQRRVTCGTRTLRRVMAPHHVRARRRCDPAHPPVDRAEGWTAGVVVAGRMAAAAGRTLDVPTRARRDPRARSPILGSAPARGGGAAELDVAAARDRPLGRPSAFAATVHIPDGGSPRPARVASRAAPRPSHPVRGARPGRCPPRRSAAPRSGRRLTRAARSRRPSSPVSSSQGTSVRSASGRARSHCS